MTINAENPLFPHSDHLQEIYEKQLVSPDPIEYFRQLTSLENPRLDFIMGSVKDAVSREAFAAYCSHLAEGAAYVREKYGSQPAGIFIIDQADAPETSGVFADPNTYSIYISREHIAEAILRERMRTGKAEPFMVNANQSAFALGVEEAFHVHQLLNYPVTAMAHDVMRELHQEITSTSKEYDSLPLEHHAMQVVHQALRDKGITDTAPLIITHQSPEKSEWASDILKERTAVTYAPQQRSI
jgi:hypothetical protein